MPPGRTMMLTKSASGIGLSTRATGVRLVSAVSEDTPVRADAWELEPAVDTALGIELLELAGGRVGTRYSSGRGTQWLQNWNVPRFNSTTRVQNSGRSTPVRPAAMFVPTPWRYSCILTCTERTTQGK